MLVGKLTRVDVVVWSLAALMAGFAAAHAKGAEWKPSLDFRAEAVYDDLGETEEENKKDNTFEQHLPIVRVSLKYNPEDDTLLKVRYHLIKEELEEGYLEKTLLGDQFVFTLGKKKIYQGGFMQKKSSPDKFIGGAYIEESKPFSSYLPVAEFKYKQGPAFVGMQLLNDRVRPKATVNTRHKQPAWILHAGWEAEPVGVWTQYGSYDINNSYFAVLSLSGKWEGLQAYLDYVMDQRTVGEPVAGYEIDHMSSYQLDLEYTFGIAAAVLQAAVFDRKQAEKDLEGNPAAKCECGKRTDNAQELAVGGKYLGFGKAFKPFLVFVMRKGDFYEEATADTEARTGQQVIAGVQGEL